MGFFAEERRDGSRGMVMSALAGIAAALAGAIFLTVYFRSGYRSLREILKHGLAAAAVLVLLAFVAYDMRHAALAYLRINASNPAVELEIRLPKPALSNIAAAQIELRPHPNQTRAHVHAS